MDARAAKLALARQKLKDHQEKKVIQKEEKSESYLLNHQLPVTEKCAAINENGNMEVYKPKDIESEELESNLFIDDSKRISSDVNVTEILIASKRNLEMQVNELHSKLSALEHHYSLAVESDKISKQMIYNLENMVKEINQKNQFIAAELISKDKTIEELNKLKVSLTYEKSNLCEQLDFTKSILVEKESENASLRAQLSSCQDQLDSLQLQVQQLTNGYPTNINQAINHHSEEDGILTQKISTLEQNIMKLQKEKEQTNINYELYVRELNEQLRSVLLKNEQLTREISDQSARENSLVEQISDMEIRLQNYRAEHITYSKAAPNTDFDELKQKYEDCLKKITDLTLENDEIKKENLEKEAKIKEISEANDNEYKPDNISMLKLNADITSDKVALQRATEQNKKLKKDLQELEEDFIKMTKDKLDLTEKLAAEKYLNKELTIKLAEINESAKDAKTKLMAKDEEMIRLQANCREIEKQIEKLSEPQESADNMHFEHHNMDDQQICTHSENPHICEHDSLLENSDEVKRLNLAKEDAMLKLQARFYKIMEEVADLSDEKHRLEHIILQLQNETDTICEYVALYQHQRCLLKKRDEERSAQIKLFQSECERLKRQIEELSRILIRFADDKELISYFQLESRQNDKEKIMRLITELKGNSLIDPIKNSLDLSNFYPCSCCSGQLIDL